MKVWDGVSGTKIDFNWDATTSTSGTIAYMTENINLTHGLISRLDELGGVEVLDKSIVEGIRNGVDNGEVNLSGWPVVEVSGGRRLTARLLVGADGADSPVRKWAEVESRGWDYGKMGVVATLQLQGSGVEDQKTAYQRFLPTGPVAFLPVSVLQSSPWCDTSINICVLIGVATRKFSDPGLVNNTKASCSIEVPISG